MGKIFFASFLGATLMALGISLWPRNQSPYGHLGGDFQLSSPQGKVSLKDFSGKNLILYFGLTQCPDVCPLALSVLASHVNHLSEKEQKYLQVAFVSVDWQRDTPQLAQDYAQSFHPNFLGLAGSQKEVQDLMKSYRAYAQGGDHTSRFYVVGPRGILRAILEDSVGLREFQQAL